MPNSLIVSHCISTAQHRTMHKGAFLLVSLLLVASLGYAQSVEVLHAFHGGRGGSSPNGLILGSKERLIGTAGGGPGCKPVSCGIIYELNSKGEEFLLHGFTGTDGSTPNHLVPDGTGGLYGVTYTGDAYGCGNVFHLNSSGFQVLYTFKNNPDGCMGDNLIMGSDGNLYGTTYIGGSNSGTVFKLDPSGHEAVLYAFTGGTDGLLPGSSLIEAGGSLYGTTYAGGTGCLGNPGCGVVYQIDQGGKETVLYSFTDTDGDGETPNSLLRDSTGNLIGSTSLGGNSACEAGCGTLFELTKGSSGWSENVIYHFTGGADGSHPNGLVSEKGNFYGATSDGTSGGCSGTACGTIFKVDATGKFATLYTFTNQADGEDPVLSFVKTGTFVGTTFYGGDFKCPDNYGYGCGTVFAFTP